jgi:hypothetical protein
MPANLLSSSSLLSGTVVVMLLLWLCGSALMTLSVGAKHQRGISPVRTPGEPDQMNPADPPDQDADEPFTGPLGQPRVTGESQATGAASSLGLTKGQRAAEYAGPEMAFFAASADS